MRLLLTSAAAALLPTVAAAAAAELADQEPIIVTGQAIGYRAVDTVFATKTDAKLIDIPQSLSVITREQIDDQAQRSLSEVLRYLPGVTVGQGEGNRDQVTIRGQNTTADFFTDGVRDDVQYFRPLYNIERVEILKGPNALLFGRGGGGGIVNRVQKTPLSDRLSVGGDAGVDTLGAWIVAADVNAPLNGRAAVRTNLFYEALDNHRDFYEGERWAVNPFVAVELATGWTIGASFEHLEDSRVTDRGIPALSGTRRPLPGARDVFYGVPGINRTGLNADVARLHLDGALADGLNWSTWVVYGDYDKYYANVFPNGPADAPAGVVPIAGYRDATDRENLFVQSNLIWKPVIGPTRHTLLAGVEYGDQHSRNARLNPTLGAGFLRVVDPVYPSVAFTTLVNDRKSDVTVFSAYAQDQVALGDWVEVVAGVRYDRFDIKGVDFIPNPDRPFARIDEKVSPRFGLILKPLRNLSAYGSFARSFLPRSGDQFLNLTVAQQDLAPESFTNYEAGVKWDIRPDLAATVALFRLDRTNATTPDPNNVSQSINVGRTRTEGVEAGLTGRVLPGLQASIAYSYQDARLVGNGGVRLAQTPEHQFTAWGRYDISARFGVGAGVIHQSSQFAAIRTSAATTRLPAFTRVDAALFVRLNEKLQAQVNVENLFDVEYFPDAHNNNNISTGAPINARFTLRARY